MIKFRITLVFIFIAKIAFAQPPAIKSEVIGRGKPILFLPGFTVPGSIWKETVKNLKTKNECHLISYAGFNGNEAIEMPWYESIKESLIQYIKNNELTDIQIIGHSMGGNLAVDIAAELPDRVKKLVLVEALPCMREVMMPGVPADNLHYESPYNNRILNMDSVQFVGMASMMANNMTLKKKKANVLSQWIIEADRKTYVYGYTDLLKLDLRRVLGKVKAVTLILGASFPDVNIAKANYDKQYAKLTNKTIEMATDSKHFIMFDQPEWFYEKVNNFLSNE